MEAGCALVGGETAEMPGLYSGADYDLAGFAVGAVERGKLLPAAGVAAGDQLIGLPSSGAHSNGFSLIRKIVAESRLGLAAPAPFAPAQSLGQALLTPTRIYVKTILPILAAHSGVKALAHITGGGFPDNVPRALPPGVSAEVDLSAITPPAVFSWLASTGRVDAAEMLRAFNCGVGMVLIVAAAEAEAVGDSLRAAGEEPIALGRVIPAAAERVVNIGRLAL